MVSAIFSILKSKIQVLLLGIWNSLWSSTDDLLLIQLFISPNSSYAADTWSCSMFLILWCRLPVFSLFIFCDKGYISEEEYIGEDCGCQQLVSVPTKPWGEATIGIDFHFSWAIGIRSCSRSVLIIKFLSLRSKLTFPFLLCDNGMDALHV